MIYTRSVVIIRDANARDQSFKKKKKFDIFFNNLARYTGCFFYRGPGDSKYNIMFILLPEIRMIE